MAFDADRYDREVIKPLRGQHGRLPAGNLAVRYAVEPGWTAAELAAHLAVIRRFWHDRAVGPDSRAEICRLLIRADEELARTVGDLMNDPAWWQEQGVATSGTETGPTAMRNRVRDAGSRATPAVERMPDASGAVEADAVDASWRAEARQFLLARLDDPTATTTAVPGDRRGVRRPGAGSATAASAPGQPDVVAAGSAWPAVERSGPPHLVPEVTVAALGARDDRCRVRVSWRDSGGDRVRIRRSGTPPPWAAGTALPRAALDEFGVELAGRMEHGDGEVRLTAEVPVGYHLYVPFRVDREWVTVGRFVALGIAEPVRRLRAERRGDDVVVTWIWPRGSRYAVVEWPAPDGVQRREVSRSAYAGANGFRVPAVTQPVAFRVTVMTDVAGDEVLSPPREVMLPPRPVSVSYTLNRHWRWYVGRREVTVRLRAEAELSDVVATVVLGAEPTMPEDAAQGTVLTERGPVDLRPGEPYDVSVLVPPLPRRAHPHWIRCFVRGPVPIVVALPAVESMKVT
ncbi:hypothetical protein ACL02O_03715 [Micromonospora sp. MS34]|uniref:hypothetical protein n=1 Tax=Micromonospora sp. MS34 TaxID=3385971 RepID=UPI0039A11876